MTQTELNREVAYATGESVDTIAQMGFVVLTRTRCSGSRNCYSCGRGDRIMIDGSRAGETSAIWRTCQQAAVVRGQDEGDYRGEEDELGDSPNRQSTSWGWHCRSTRPFSGSSMSTSPTRCHRIWEARSGKRRAAPPRATARRPPSDEQRWGSSVSGRRT